MRALWVFVLLAPACGAADFRASQLNALAQAAATGRPQDTARVRDLTTEALRIERETKDPAEAITLGILGEQLYEAGEFREARTVLESAAGIAAERFGKDSTQVADVDMKLAAALIPFGDYGRSASLSREALAVYEARFGQKDSHVGRALSRLGSAQLNAGEYTGAVASLEQAVRILEESEGARSPATGKTLTQLAFAIFSTGDLARARLTAERAISILDPLADSAAGDAQRVMGEILLELADYPSARAAQDRALQIFEKWYGPDSITVADDLVGIGNAARGVGDLERARDTTSRAVAIYEARLGPENSRVGGSVDNLGQVLVLMKQWDAARACFQRALAIQTKALGPRNPWTANVLQGLAKVAAGTGHYAEAESLLNTNLEIWREQLGPAHPSTAVSLNLLAGVMAHRGERAAALKTALEAARIARDEIAYTVRSVDERQALKFAAHRSDALDTALSLIAAGASADAAAVWDETIRSRALVLDEMAARNRSVRASRDPAAQVLIGEETRARSELARLAMQGKGSRTVEDWRKLLGEKRDAVYRADEALAAKSAAYRGLERERAGLEEVARALPAGTALVAYVRYNRIDFSAPGDASAPAYMAFVLKQGARYPQAAPIGPASRVDAQAANVRAEMARERDSEGHSERRNEASYRTAGEALRRTVWDPVARLLAGAAAVYVIPDGSLQLINLAALPTGTTQYLAEAGPLLHFLSAERDMVKSDAPRPRGSGLLAVGNPAYDTAATAGAPAAMRSALEGCGDFARMRFDPLPGSAREIEELASIWKHEGWNAETLTGSRATESTLRKDAAGKRVIHLATHGFFLEGRCQAAATLAENPLLRSGLALAAANRRAAAREGSDDGILTAEEAASLDLAGTEWVVLSGCDTGIGDLAAGEGVLGLQRAFEEAGAGAVIASLWPVADEDATQWMATLYRSHFVDGRGTAQAVRAAERSAIATRRAKSLSTHPFYWASFVATERQ